MKTLKCSGKTYVLDDWGFLADPTRWDEDFARAMAARQGIRGGLLSAHWSFIRYIRRRFTEDRDLPLLVVACSENHLRLAELRRLFPTGYHRGACRVAGLSYDFIASVNIWHTYETAPHRKPPYDMDRLGFMVEHGQWDPAFVDYLDRLSPQNTPLSSEDSSRRMQVLLFLRRNYQREGCIPSVYCTCSATGLRLRDLHRLFPQGYRRGACRYAGLPSQG